MAERSRAFSLLEGGRPRFTDTRLAVAALSSWATEGTGSALHARMVPGMRRAEPPPAGARGLGSTLRAAARPGPSATLESVQASLAAGEIVLDVVTWGPEAAGGVALVLGPRSVECVDLRGDLVEASLGLGAAADRMAMARGTGLAHAARASLDRHLANVSRMLLDPLERHLQGAVRVFVVPHGGLLGVPTAALPHPATGEPLGSTHELVHAPSAGWVAMRPRRRPAHAPILALGISDEVAPHVEAEIAGIAASGARVTAHVGASATWEALVRDAPRAKVVHVAGHGVFRWDNPDLSALKLADRWISVAEIESLPLRAELTVLSACEAGALGSRGGAQFAGIVRALLRAGSRTVIASPWSVPDELAAGFFPELHARLCRGQSIPSALAGTSRTLAASPDALAAWSFGAWGSPWCG
jgi:hypothetical protein